jgi:hypothetical protein
MAIHNDSTSTLRCLLYKRLHIALIELASSKKVCDIPLMIDKTANSYVLLISQRATLAIPH